MGKNLIFRKLKKKKKKLKFFSSLLRFDIQNGTYKSRGSETNDNTIRLLILPVASTTYRE